MCGTFHVMNENSPDKCMGCGSSNVTVSFDPRYNGFRGSCIRCGGNWPES